MKLKIFSDQNFLLSGTEPDPILYPFWPKLYSRTEYAWLNPYDKYVELGHQIFDFTSTLTESDIAIVPVNWLTVRGGSWRRKKNKDAENLALQFSQIVAQTQKPLILFFSGDCSDEKVSVQNAIVSRMSVYRSRLKSPTLIHPAFCEDIIKHYFDDILPIREKSSKARVGFRGFARPINLVRRIKSVAYHSHKVLTEQRWGISTYKGQILRHEICNTLSRSSLIETNFEINTNSVFFGSNDFDYKQRMRVAYVNNIIESDYTLCCRGASNYSNRFYEVLCCGRIPVFVDTDCVLPFSNLIDWKKYCVWVEETEIPYIDEKIAEFHESLSPESFVELQHQCRKLWLNKLSPEGFYSNFHEQLISMNILA